MQYLYRIINNIISKLSLYSPDLKINDAASTRDTITTADNIIIAIWSNSLTVCFAYQQAV